MFIIVGKKINWIRSDKLRLQAIQAFDEEKHIYVYLMRFDI